MAESLEKCLDPRMNRGIPVFHGSLHFCSTLGSAFNSIGKAKSRLRKRSRERNVEQHGRNIPKTRILKKSILIGSTVTAVDVEFLYRTEVASIANTPSTKQGKK